MDITPLIDERANIIQGYDAKGFRIHGKRYQYPILLTPSHVGRWDIDPEKAEWSKEDFQFLEDLTLDILLVGRGSKAQFITPDQKPDSVMIDVMETGAACRTYNVLLAEGRAVGAALIL